MGLLAWCYTFGLLNYLVVGHVLSSPGGQEPRQKSTAVVHLYRGMRISYCSPGKVHEQLTSLKYFDKARPNSDHTSREQELVGFEARHAY